MSFHAEEMAVIVIIIKSDAFYLQLVQYGLLI